MYNDWQKSLQYQKMFNKQEINLSFNEPKNHQNIINVMIAKKLTNDTESRKNNHSKNTHNN